VGVCDDDGGGGGGGGISSCDPDMFSFEGWRFITGFVYSSYSEFLIGSDTTCESLKTEVRVGQTQFEPMVLAEVVSHFLERGTSDVSHDKMIEFFVFVTPIAHKMRLDIIRRSLSVLSDVQDHGSQKEATIFTADSSFSTVGSFVAYTRTTLEPNDSAFRVSANGPALGVLFRASA
ncbi:hypothetical protein Tco_0983459, partial [Tanacetum coccineum]